MKISKPAGIVVAAISVIVCSGCASQILQSYVGKDVREVVLDYGPPASTLDMGDGRRAFQWAPRRSVTTPPVVRTEGSAERVGNSVTWESNTTLEGGTMMTSPCVYTLFATWDETTHGWRVVDFRKPNPMCE